MGTSDEKCGKVGEDDTPAGRHRNICASKLQELQAGCDVPQLQVNLFHGVVSGGHRPRQVQVPKDVHHGSRYRQDCQGKRTKKQIQPQTRGTKRGGVKRPPPEGMATVTLTGGEERLYREPIHSQSGPACSSLGIKIKKGGRKM